MSVEDGYEYDYGYWCSGIATEPSPQIVRLEAERETLLAALRTYGQHKEGCVFVKSVIWSSRPAICTCGLGAALASVGGES